MNEGSPHGFSVTGDIKIYHVTWPKGNGVTTPSVEMLYGLHEQTVFTAQIW